MSHENGKVYVITSGKGGVGKTTTTANISTGLAMLGKKVAVIDADIGLRNLDVIMGLENRIVYDIIDVVEGRAKLENALIKDRHFRENLQLLPAAQTRDKEALTKDGMDKILTELRKTFDFIIVDCPAGIEQGFKIATMGADHVLIVTNPEVSAVRDADRIIGLLESQGKKDIKLIINRIRPEMVKRGDMLDIEDVLDLLKIELIGIVPEDQEIVVSANKGEPLVRDSHCLAGQAYRNITKRILGEKLPLLDISKQAGFFTKLFKKKVRK
ncbi:MAG: septum site-determining protein MinD [Fusobacteria bacterium]|nr:septum site-determining protein MinD [Fusobacteriota bacterium]